MDKPQIQQTNKPESTTYQTLTLALPNKQQAHTRPPRMDADGSAGIRRASDRFRIFGRFWREISNGACQGRARAAGRLALRRLKARSAGVGPGLTGLGWVFRACARMGSNLLLYQVGMDSVAFFWTVANCL